MPENVAKSMDRIESALKRLSKTDAEYVAANAADRAEAIADYAERIANAQQAPAQ